MVNLVDNFSCDKSRRRKIVHVHSCNYFNISSNVIFHCAFKLLKHCNRKPNSKENSTETSYEYCSITQSMCFHLRVKMNASELQFGVVTIMMMTMINKKNIWAYEHTIFHSTTLHSICWLLLLCLCHRKQQQHHHHQPK